MSAGGAAAGRKPADLPPGWWGELGEVLRRGDGAVVRGPRRPELRARWEEIARRERELDDRLFIGLVGGTGVGKSTLINAIAGVEISEISDRRPTTDRIVVYRHAAETLPAALPKLDLSEPQKTHESPGLERLVILDFPDFDSVEADHAEILGRCLPHLDITLVVVDDTKYGDLRLFEVLRTFPHSPRNLYFVLNKIDRLEARYHAGAPGVVADLLGDFRSKLESHLGWPAEPARLIAISARAALEARRGGAAGKGSAGDGKDAAGKDGAAAGEFPRLLDILEEYRSRKRRLAAKEVNIEHLKRELARAARAAFLDPLPADLARRARGRLAAGIAELRELMAATPREVLAVRERSALRAATVRRLRLRLRFPMDLLFIISSELRLRRGASRRQPAAALAARLRAHYAPLSDALRVLDRGLRLEAGDAVAGEPPEEAGQPQPPRWDSLLEESIVRRTAPLLRFRRLRNNLLPLAAVIAFLWWLLHPVALEAARGLLGEQGVEWGALLRRGALAVIGGLSPAFIFGALGTVLLLYAAGAFILWARIAHAVEDSIAEVEESAREQAAGEMDAAARRLESSIARFEVERAAIDRLLAAALGDGG